MRRLAILLVTASHWMIAQPQPPAYPPKGAPAFTPGDPDGLVVARNPQIRKAWLRPVHWRNDGLNIHAIDGLPAVTAAERAQINKTLDSLAAALKATAEGSQGLGYWVNESRHMMGAGRSQLPTSTVPLARWPLPFELGVFPFYHEDIQSAKGEWRKSVRGETESVSYRFNTFPGRIDRPVVATEDRGPDRTPVEFYLRPRETARVGGFPLYEAQLLLVTRAGRDPWAPVPLGRLLKALVPKYQGDLQSAEQRLDGYRKKNAEAQSPEFERTEWERFEKNNGALKTTRPGNYEARKRSLEHYIKVTRADADAAANPPRGDAKGAWYWNPKEAHDQAVARVAALTPAEAAQPACLVAYKETERDGRYQVIGHIRTGEARPDCSPVVMDNPEYFDARLGRAAVQIAMVSNFGRCAAVVNGQIVSGAWASTYDRAPPQGCYRHALMWRDFDWAKFAALLTP